MTEKGMVSKGLVSELETGRLVHRKNRKAMRNLLKKAHEDYLTEERLDIPRKEKTIKPLYYYLAASVLAVVIFTGLYFNFILPSEQIDTEKIYTEFYQPYPLSSEVLSNNLSKDDNLRVAYIAYSNNKYALASELFGRAIEKQSGLIDAIFFRGIAFMETGQHKQSIESFKAVIQNKNNNYLSHAHWYTALTWIKLNSPKEALSHLVWLRENNTNMQKKANDLIIRISK
jgi:tetratricopeptide (TPR) repeat protein